MTTQMTLAANPADPAELQALAGALTGAELAAVQARFPRLTLVDALAVLAQRPDATDVRPFVAWLRDGRRVRHGEHGIVLPERAPGVTRARVFDIDQTDPDPGADRPARAATAATALRDDLTLPAAVDTTRLAAAPDQPMELATSRYAGFNPAWGVPVRITVGAPRGFRHSYAQVLALAPYELFKPPYKGIDDVKVEQLVYNRRLDAHAGEILTQLRAIAAQYPGQRAVLLCYENVNAGEACHRRWAAEWFTARYGWHIPEIDPRNPGDQPPSIPPEHTLF